MKPKPKSKPLDLLKQGLAILKQKLQEKKARLTDRLNRGEVLTSQEEKWLDDDANIVDEERVVEALDDASDYERHLKKMNSQDRSLVTKLRQLAGEVGKTSKAAGPSRKRKRPEPKSKPAVEKQTQPVPDCKIKQFSTGKRQRATNEVRIEILDYLRCRGQNNQSETARHFAPLYPDLNITQPKISEWAANEEAWREKLQRDGRDSKRVRQTEFPQIEEMLGLWVMKAMDDGLELKGDLIREKWKDFARLEGIPEEDWLHLSSGWLTSFKKHHGLRAQKLHGEAVSADVAEVEAERQQIQQLIAELGYLAKDVFNTSETGHFWAMVPDRRLATSRHSDQKMKRNRLTYLFTTNADGSERCMPLVIGKFAQPRAFQRRAASSLGFLYRNNAMAWMTTKIYQEWLSNWDKQLRSKNRHILLLQANLAGHIPPEGLTNIRVETFASNLTTLIQPLDQGIIRCLKAHYRAFTMERAVRRFDSEIAPAEIYDLNILEAMRLANMAWDEIDTTTIRSCWGKAGILPEGFFATSTATDIHVLIKSLLDTPLVTDSSTSDPTSTDAAEQAIQTALDDLVHRGVLRTANRLSIEELLNPKGESSLMDGSTDQEIHQAVSDAAKATADMEINGGDDGADGSESITPCPPLKDVLQAITVLDSFANLSGDESARRLQSTLVSFGRSLRLDQQRAMKRNRITDNSLGS